MLIAGNWAERKSGETFEVTNPANGDVITELPDGGREEAARAIDAAYEAFPAWAARQPMIDRRFSIVPGS